MISGMYYYSKHDDYTISWHDSQLVDIKGVRECDRIIVFKNVFKNVFLFINILK